MANENIPLSVTKLKQFVSEEANEVSQAQGETREKHTWTMTDSSGGNKEGKAIQFLIKDKYNQSNRPQILIWD
eukprot:13778286-Ditylum_brightwellii.AAC.1